MDASRCTASVITSVQGQSGFLSEMGRAESGESLVWGRVGRLCPEWRADVKPLVRTGLPRSRPHTRGFTLVPHLATLDVSRPVAEYLARLLGAHRRRIRTPRGSRVLGLFRQAVMVLRWFREAGCVHCLARDADISRPPATATSTRASTSWPPPRTWPAPRPCPLSG